MALSCDGAPIELWTIPWPALGPFCVEEFDTSFRKKDGSKIPAYRVVGKSGFQLHTSFGCVIQRDRDYAELIASAANEGILRQTLSLQGGHDE